MFRPKLLAFLREFVGFLARVADGSTCMVESRLGGGRVEIIRTCSDRPCEPPSLGLSREYCVEGFTLNITPT